MTTTSAPPRQPSFAHPNGSSVYAEDGYGQQTPSPPSQTHLGSNPLQLQFQQQRQQQQQRAMSPSSSAYGSYQGHQVSPYTPPPPASQQYIPPEPSQQLHPQEAYATDPFAHRRRKSSSASHHSTASRRSERSTHSHRSHHSNHSTHSRGTGSNRKAGERATMGDTLFGMWDILLNLIPVGKR